MTRNIVLVGMTLFAAFAVSIAAADHPDRYTSDEHGDLLEAARKIIDKDPYPVLVTTDDQGRSRTRMVELRPLEDDWVFWIATNPITRKVAQIESTPEVTLYFARDNQFSYVSVMGRASLHTDLETLKAISWRDEPKLAMFWPEFPDDYMLIRIVPEWIEVTGQGIASHPVDWRPQAFEVEVEK